MACLPAVPSGRDLKLTTNFSPFIGLHFYLVGIFSRYESESCEQILVALCLAAESSIKKRYQEYQHKFFLYLYLV